MSTLHPPVGSTDHVAGASNPVVTIVEYGDYQCPYCRQAYPVVKQLLADHADQVRLVFRNFPLTDLHPEALNAAVVAEFAAEGGKFWQAHDLLYQHQNRLGRELYTEIVTELGLSLDGLKQTLTDQRLVPAIQQQVDDGIRSGVNGTPCFFVNGTRFDSPQGWTDLPNAVEALLNG